MENPKEKGSSRREFLKETFGGGIATALLAELGFPKKVLAQLEEVLKVREFMDISLEEGVQRLEGYVWDKKEEHYWIYIERGEKRGWIDIVRIATEDEIKKVINIAPLFDDAAITKLYFMHTHPVDIYRKDKLLTDEAIELLAKERRSNFPLPPTGNDIISIIRAKRFMREDNSPAHEIKHLMAEPAGVWEYDVDENHPKMKEVIAALLEDDTKLASAMHNSLIEWRGKVIHQGGFSKKDLGEIKEWARREYGITLSYRH